MWKTASFLVGAVLILLVLGIVMLASTSGIQAQAQHGDYFFYVKRQGLWLALGIVAALVAGRMDYHLWGRLALPLYVLALAMLVMTLIPGVGQNIKGSSRWLRFGPFNLQPSEFAKLATLNVLAWWYARGQRHTREFRKGLVIPLGLLGVVLMLIFAEPDFGSTLLLGSAGLCVMFAAGVPFGYLFLVALVGVLGFILAVLKDPVRMRRVTSFWEPEKYAQDEGYQLVNAIYAFVMGGAAGVGFGQSVQKQFYLPEAHTDFIFAIIGEELGLAATLLVVASFMAILVCGFRISWAASDVFGKLLSFGITVLLALQGAINIGVVTGCLPTKGLPLPFISFGGSSMLINLAMVGILVNVARRAMDDESDAARRDPAHAHWF